MRGYKVIFKFSQTKTRSVEQAFGIHEEVFEQVLDEKGLSIKEFQFLVLETSKRTLQRELKKLFKMELLRVEGLTNERRYLVNL